jgi:hypothetical protein
MAIRRFHKDLVLRRQARWKWRRKSLARLIAAMEMARQSCRRRPEQERDKQDDVGKGRGNRGPITRSPKTLQKKAPKPVIWWETDSTKCGRLEAVREELN